MAGRDRPRALPAPPLGEDWAADGHSRITGETTMADLTPDQMKKIVDELAGLRTQLRDNGATALSPTPEWKALRKEIALLNKKLNADTASKEDARQAALNAGDAESSPATG